MRLFLRCMRFSAILSVIFVLIFQSVLLAQEKNEEDNICSDDVLTRDDIDCFDLDKDNLISEKEYASFIKHRDYEVYRVLDTDKNGVISQAEFEIYLNSINNELKFRLAIEEFKNFAFEDDPENKLSKKKAASIAIEPTAGSRQINLLGFQLREKYEDVRVSKNVEDNFSRFNGALLSFTSDFKNNNDIFQAKGAIFRPIRISSNKAPSGNKPAVLTGIIINPGVSFDRINNSTSDNNDVDVLEFRLGSELEFSGGGLFDNQYLRVSLLYETDFDLNTGIFLGELQWEPLNLEIGIGVAKKVGFFSYRLRPILHLEGGEDFLRIGPKLSLEIWPEGPLEIFTLNIDYEFFQTILNNSETRDLFNIGLALRLDQGGNTTIETDYRSGKISLDGQDVDEFSFGFGLKF